MPRAVRRGSPRVVACGYVLVWSSALSLALAAVAAAVALVSLYLASRFPTDLRDEMKRVNMPGELQAAFIDRQGMRSELSRDLTPEQREVFNKCLAHMSENTPDVMSVLLGLAAALLVGYSAIAFTLGRPLLRRTQVVMCDRCKTPVATAPTP